MSDLPATPPVEEAPPGLATSGRICGAENPDYPDEYVCTEPVGHGPIEGHAHANRAVGAFWTARPVSGDTEGLREVLAEAARREIQEMYCHDAPRLADRIGTRALAVVQPLLDQAAKDRDEIERLRDALAESERQIQAAFRDLNEEISRGNRYRAAGEAVRREAQESADAWGHGGNLKVADQFQAIVDAADAALASTTERPGGHDGLARCTEHQDAHNADCRYCRLAQWSVDNLAAPPTTERSDASPHGEALRHELRRAAEQRDRLPSWSKRQLPALARPTPDEKR